MKKLYRFSHFAVEKWWKKSLPFLICIFGRFLSFFLFLSFVTAVLSRMNRRISYEIVFLSLSLDVSIVRKWKQPPESFVAFAVFIVELNEHVHF